MVRINLRSISPLEVESGRLYQGGFEDEVVEQLAYEDGQAAIHNSTMWGENTYPHTLEALTAAHDVDARLISHQYRGDVQEVVGQIAITVPMATSALAQALDALEDKRRAQVAVLRLRDEIKAHGLNVPGVRALWWLIAGLTALFLGETPLNSTSFQVFGLSDRPLIPYLPLTDELHLAAYGSVTALLVLAHVAGHKLRLVAHDVTRRRTATTDEAKAELPRVSWFQVGIVVACIVAAIPILGGLSLVRADYLQAQGHDAQTLPFLAIQIGIFVAAVLLGFYHAHPYGRAWANVRQEDKAAEKTWATAEGRYNDLVSEVNTNIERLGMLLAQAGHHVAASEADARRQIALYARRATLSQPEPTVNRLLPKKLPEPSVRTGTALANFLTGATSVPTFEKLTTTALSDHRDKIRTELCDLERALNQTAITDAPSESSPPPESSGNTGDLDAELAALGGSES